MSKAVKVNDFLEIVKGRRSIRNYDENVKISKEEMKAILADTTLAPSAVNLQPWRFVVVESDEAKKKLRPLVKFNVLQNDTSAAMILIFGDLKCYEKAEEIFDQAVSAGKMPQDVKEKQLSEVIPIYTGYTKQEINDVVKIDSSLAAMQLVLVARAYGYDTNIIGGFEADQLAESFGLDPERYVPVTIISIGLANEAGYSSVRLPVEEVTTWK